MELRFFTWDELEILSPEFAAERIDAETAAREAALLDSATVRDTVERGPRSMLCVSDALVRETVGVLRQAHGSLEGVGSAKTASQSLVWAGSLAGLGLVPCAALLPAFVSGSKPKSSTLALSLSSDEEILREAAERAALPPDVAARLASKVHELDQCRVVDFGSPADDEAVCFAMHVSEAMAARAMRELLEAEQSVPKRPAAKKTGNNGTAAKPAAAAATAAAAAAAVVTMETTKAKTSTKTKPVPPPRPVRSLVMQLGFLVRLPLLATLRNRRGSR